ncbi:MAG: hypothetical protein R6V61_10745 [Wenzhouxiangellaceae bacterium]
MVDPETHEYTIHDLPQIPSVSSPGTHLVARNDPEHSIPYQIQDYLELVDWSGRAIIEGKRGKIPDDLPPILDRLKINPVNYVRLISRPQKSRFHGFIGSVKSMKNLAADFGRSFLKGQAAAAALFSPG